MNFKKGGPGCPCDCSEQDCEDRCLIPCTGGTPPDDCNFCEIDIQLPAPENTGIDPLLLPPEECPDEAPCWACYQVFDLRFPFRDSAPGGNCNDWSINWIPNGGPQQDLPNTLLRRNLLWHIEPCWSRSNYSCPYDSPDSGNCFDSNIFIGPVLPFSDQIANEMLGHYFQLSGNEWDGSCGKLTFKIAYTVIELNANYLTLPIDPENPDCTDYKWTAYLHTFELNYCTCEEVLDAFTFVSTESEDSCAGGVDDPCHLDQATIVIRKSDSNANCGACACLNCQGYKSTEIQVVISGPTINGTFMLQGDGSCYFSYANTNGIGDCAEIQQIAVQISCLACDQFKAQFSASGFGDFFAESDYTEAFECDGTATIGDLAIYNESANDCNLSGHSIQVSFVPS